MQRFDANRSKQVPLVYLAGPYTNPNPAWNTRNTLKLADTIIDTGLMIPVIPHLSHFWDEISPRPYSHWIEYDKHLLGACDALYRIPGTSPGAENEVRVAVELGIPVFHHYDDLSAWASKYNKAIKKMYDRRELPTEPDDPF